MNEKVVVCCTPFGTDWRWVIEDQAASDVHWKYFSDKPKHFWQRYLQKPNLNTPVACFRSVSYARRHKAQLLITFDARLSFWCCLISRILGIKLNHLAFSFNFPKLPGGFKRRLFQFAYQVLDNLFVHSNAERKLYSEYFAIPEERIKVKLCTMNVPAVSPDPPALNTPYVSAIGGNARDYQTLLEASRLLPEVPMVWVVRPENVSGLDLPPHVHILSNIPYPQAMNVLKHSLLTVVPLRDSQVPCGHITFVSAMFLEKAIVVTDSSGISDYVKDGWNGLFCRPKDASDLAAKINVLWKDSGKRDQMGANGFKFADEHCSERLMRADMMEIFRANGLAPESSPRAIDQSPLATLP
jgi:glycosyltransferase involved in cell wall biosynthesis